ncbi:hypothetical protein CT694_34600 (plasmid) [Bacillus wiedmannii bv. thuringiensis]|nr:hypothetical protein CT694_34600 [Bacillus wiedmannii bv. thuringiensis]
MSTSDGHVIGTTKVIDHGSPNQRFNLVILSDGYKEDEIPNFETNVQDFINILQATPPFNQLWDGINIYRVDVASTDSGADDPVSCEGSGLSVRTYFDSTFCTNNIRRLLTANVNTAISVTNSEVPEYHAIMILVNSSISGGSGGAIGVASTASQFAEILIHEMGHTIFGLADEYPYYKGCGQETDRDRYPEDIEPSEPNITTDTNITTNKWKDLILPTTTMPTMSNPDCTQCNSNPSPVPTGTVGAFEGAGYYHCGLYRPEYDCKMRNLGVSFCSVCQKRIIDSMSIYL